MRSAQGAWVCWSRAAAELVVARGEALFGLLVLVGHEVVLLGEERPACDKETAYGERGAELGTEEAAPDDGHSLQLEEGDESG